jgi:hypothetical protein
MCRDGGTGRRSGLKIRRPLRSWGFDPPSRHQLTCLLSIFYMNLYPELCLLRVEVNRSVFSQDEFYKPAPLIQERDHQ